MKRKQGISLIVLIITIVVVIILATAIIMNLSNTNVINNASEAVVKQDFKTLQDELNMYMADKYTEETGDFNPEQVNATTKAEVAQIIPSITKTNYADYVLIENGEIAISDLMPEPQKTWAMEALGLISSSNNTPTDSDQTNNVALDNMQGTKNESITGEEFAYNNPVIPVGFKAVNTTDASWADENEDGCPDGWNNGLVIQDDDLNEFVWVPCTTDGKNGTITYAKNMDYPKQSGITSVSDDADALPMKDATTRVTETEQITKYGGFYIGRYEAGVPANQTTIDGNHGSDRISKSDADGIPVVKKGATVWGCISYDKAMPNAKKLYENSSSVRSGLLTGTQWDTVCAWIQSETDSNGNVIHDVTNSVSWGNYSGTTGNAQYDIDGTTKISGTKQTAGKSEYWKAKNIYDIAGNTWELTGEIYSSSFISRGGCYNNSYGSNYLASYRLAGTISGGTNDSVSFRIALYVM